MYQQQQNPYLPPMDYFNHESNVLHRTGKQIDDYIAMSKSALQELYDQKNILKVYLFFFKKNIYIYKFLIFNFL